MAKRESLNPVEDTLIQLEHILFDLDVENKKQALEALAKLASPLTGLSEHDIFDILFAREKLGTTGVGHGIAIPHGKIENADKVYGFFARLAKPIDFESVDEQPVDIMFMLLAPHDAGADHLKALAKVSRMLRDKTFVAKLRSATDAKVLHALLSEGEQHGETSA